jgi:hypothetical protein
MASSTYIVQISKGTAQPPDKAWRPALNAPSVYIGTSDAQIDRARNNAIVALMAAVHCDGMLWRASEAAPIGYAIVTVQKAGGR